MATSYYIRRKVKAASERGRRMANARWEKERKERDKMALLTAEQCPSRIVRRIVVIDNEATVREATFWSFESRRSWRRKLRLVLYPTQKNNHGTPNSI
ncbi:MAG: hypothetical protein KGL39_43810 [Patescibacteria group bacterium]|nr:hypothetical protein [Patescibacteria group bacterium]